MGPLARRGGARMSAARQTGDGAGIGMVRGSGLRCGRKSGLGAIHTGAMFCEASDKQDKFYGKTKHFLFFILLFN